MLTQPLDDGRFDVIRLRLATASPFVGHFDSGFAGNVGRSSSCGDAFSVVALIEVVHLRSVGQQLCTFDGFVYQIAEVLEAAYSSNPATIVLDQTAPFAHIGA